MTESKQNNLQDYSNIEKKLFIRLHQLPRIMRGKMKAQIAPEGFAPRRHAGCGMENLPPGIGRGRMPQAAPGPFGRMIPGERAAENHRPPHPQHHGPGPAGMLSRERILPILLHQEGGVRQKQIAQQMHVNPSSMSEFLDLLERDAYIERQVDPSDKRATLIFLTEKGKARACEIEDEHRERYSQLFGALTQEEKIELLRLLDKLCGEELPDTLHNEGKEPNPDC